MFFILDFHVLFLLNWDLTTAFLFACCRFRFVYIRKTCNLLFFIFILFGLFFHLEFLLVSFLLMRWFFFVLKFFFFLIILLSFLLIFFLLISILFLVILLSGSCALFYFFRLFSGAFILSLVKLVHLWIFSLFCIYLYNALSNIN